jgi:hypothetical protein
MQQLQLFDDLSLYEAGDVHSSSHRNQAYLTAGPLGTGRDA